MPSEASVKHERRGVIYKGVAPIQTQVAKTADYTVLEKDIGTLFTNTGAAGAVNFTLPALAAVQTGWWAEFFVTADQSVTVTAAAADVDKMIVFNDVAADSIAFSTASEKVGNGVKVISTGSKWITKVNLGAETATPTIAT